MNPKSDTATQKVYAENEFDVDKILDKRKIKGRVYYLVKWENYPRSESTWEPIENFEDCMELIEEFNDIRREKKNAKRRKKIGQRTQKAKPRAKVVQRKKYKAKNKKDSVLPENIKNDMNSNNSEEDQQCPPSQEEEMKAEVKEEPEIREELSEPPLVPDSAPVPESQVSCSQPERIHSLPPPESVLPEEEEKGLTSGIPISEFRSILNPPTRILGSRPGTRSRVEYILEWMRPPFQPVRIYLTSKQIALHWPHILVKYLEEKLRPSLLREGDTQSRIEQTP